MPNVKELQGFMLKYRWTIYSESLIPITNMLKTHWTQDIISIAINVIYRWKSLVQMASKCEIFNNCPFCGAWVWNKVVQPQDSMRVWYCKFDSDLLWYECLTFVKVWCSHCVSVNSSPTVVLSVTKQPFLLVFGDVVLSDWWVMLTQWC